MTNIVGFLTSLPLPLIALCFGPAPFAAAAIHRIFFHPLANVPGPKLAALTKLWLAWNVRKGESHAFLPSLHKKYGRVVRIAPDWVLVCDEGFVKEAYGRSCLSFGEMVLDVGLDRLARFRKHSQARLHSHDI